VCGVSCVTPGLVASPAPVCGVWAYRVLRQFPKPACIQACGSDRASDHCQLRTRRGLVLRLRKAADDQRCRVASAARASGKSARAWTSGKGASQLGIAPALACVCLVQNGRDQIAGRLLKNAMWKQDIPLQVNPISLVTVKGASKRVRQPRSLTVEQFRLLVSHLKEPFGTMALVCVCFGLRISECLALR
jgi:integrase